MTVQHCLFSGLIVLACYYHYAPAMTVWRIAGRSHLRAICALLLFLCYLLCCSAVLLVLCAMCSAALLNSSRVAAGCPIAQLSDSPPDGGSARSLSGLLPRPGNSGKLSRHETTLGEGGQDPKIIDKKKCNWIF